MEADQHHERRRKTKTGATHRPYDEAFKRAAVAPWQGGVPARRVAEGLGITTESLRAWRRQLGGADAVSGAAVAGKLPSVAPTSQELQAEVRRLRTPRQSVTNPRDMSKKPSGSSPAQAGAFRPDRSPGRPLSCPRAVRGAGRVARRLLLLASTGPECTGRSGRGTGRRDLHALRAQPTPLRQPASAPGMAAGRTRLRAAPGRPAHAGTRPRRPGGVAAGVPARPTATTRTPHRAQPARAARDAGGATQRGVGSGHHLRSPPTRAGCIWRACPIWVAAAGWVGPWARAWRRACRWARSRWRCVHGSPPVGCSNPSDRRSQYASEACREHLAAWNVTPSMSRKGNCYDSAAMESFWSPLKEELVHRRSFISRAEAAGAIFDYLETFYNRGRLHRALGFICPVEFEKQSHLNSLTNSQAPPCLLNRGNLTLRASPARGLPPWHHPPRLLAGVPGFFQPEPTAAAASAQAKPATSNAGSAPCASGPVASFVKAGPSPSAPKTIWTPSTCSSPPTTSPFNRKQRPRNHDPEIERWQTGGFYNPHFELL